MKKNILAVLIASSIGLYGCGDEKELTGNPTIDPIIEKSLKAETQINFDLISDSSNPVIVMPTFLAMDSTDGTLSVEGSVGSDGYSTNLADPQTAMGKTDGWSTTQPFVINFTGNDLDAATAVKGFYLIESKDPTDATDSAQPTSLSAADGDFMVTVSGSTLTVVLLKPLNPATNYMFAITDDLKDSKGDSVGMTGSYAVLKATTTPPSPALIPAQTIVHATEKELDTAGVSADSIIFSSWFTTTSVGDVLYATKGAIAKSIEAISLGGNAGMVWKSDSTANPNNVDATGLFGFSSTSLVPSAAVNLAVPGSLYGDGDPTNNADAIKFTAYSGKVTLPYFLETELSDNKWMKTPWQSALPSIAKILNVLKNGEEKDKAAVMKQLVVDFGITEEQIKLVSSDPTVQQDVMSKLLGKTIYLADGSQLDAERVITKYSPVPQLKSAPEVGFVLVMPPLASCAANLAPDTGTGIPVNIFQSGITRTKEDLYGLGPATISTNCQAMIAIDHPLHGVRQLSTDISATKDAQVYMNLKYLPVTRDNVRQSIIDSVSLRASLGLQFKANSAGTPDPTKPLTLLSPVNGTSVGVGSFGISLGGISGIGYTATTNRAVADNTTENAIFKVNRAQFTVPGGGLPYFLINSTTFGPTVEAGLAASFPAYKAESCEGLSDDVCKAAFYNSFAYAAQTILDTIDPINQIKLLPQDTPTYLSMVKEDEVIPNGPTVGEAYVLQSPLGGTIPLILNGGFNQITDTVDDPKKEAALFIGGGHTAIGGSVDYPEVSIEMQGQVSSFLNEGKITVGDTNLMFTVPTP